MSNYSNFIKLMRKKSSLLRCIFFTLITQLMLTFIFIKILNSLNLTKNVLISYKNSFTFKIITFLIFLGSLFLLVFILSPKLSYYQKYLLFTIFSLIQAFFLHIVLSIYSNETIVFALYATILIFIFLFMFGLITVYLGIDLGWLGILLFISLFFLIITRLVTLILNSYSYYNKLFSIISLFIFILYILYDTNKILLKYKNTDTNCINGAIDYYLDLINIFLDILRLSDN